MAIRPKGKSGVSLPRPVEDFSMKQNLTQLLTRIRGTENNPTVFIDGVGMREIKVGAVDSGGVGKRALYVDN